MDQKSGLSDLQILHFDRMIELKDGDEQIAASRGHEEARRLLKEAGADVLLWGSVLRQKDEIRSKLYWTSLSADTRGQSKSLYAVNEFELPQAFWMDLGQWIELIVENESAEAE